MRIYCVVNLSVKFRWQFITFGRITVPTFREVLPWKLPDISPTGQHRIIQYNDHGITLTVDVEVAP